MLAGMAVAEYGRGQGVRKAEAKWRIKAGRKQVRRLIRSGGSDEGPSRL